MRGIESTKNILLVILIYQLKGTSYEIRGSAVGFPSGVRGRGSEALEFAAF